MKFLSSAFGGKVESSLSAASGWAKDAFEDVEEFAGSAEDHIASAASSAWNALPSMDEVEDSISSGLHSTVDFVEEAEDKLLPSSTKIVEELGMVAAMVLMGGALILHFL